MDIHLLTLKISNFRSIKSLNLDFNGESSIIGGENRIGKTTTLESIYWLLSGYLLDGSNDSSALKPLDDTRATVVVEGTFEIDDAEKISSKIIVLRKEYGEEWSKVRNTNEIRMVGHFTNLYYNGVKQKTLKEYNALLFADLGFDPTQYAKINLLQLLINPYYVGDLGESIDWKYLRDFIIRLVGDVSDDDVFKEKPSLIPIKEDLINVGGRFDQLKKQYRDQISGVTSDISNTNAQIDLVNQTQEVSKEERDDAQKRIDEIDRSIHELEQGNNESAKLKIQSKIDKIKLDKVSLESEFKDEMTKLTEPWMTKIANLEKETSEIDSKVIENQGKLEKLNEPRTPEIAYDLNSLREKRMTIINELKATDEKIKNVDSLVDKTCPVCGQSLSQDKIESAKSKMVESLEREKEGLIEAGKKVRELIDTEESRKESRGVEEENKKHEIESLEHENGDLQLRKSRIEFEINKLKFERETVVNQKFDSYKSEIHKLDNEIVKLESEIDKLSTGNNVEKIHALTNEKMASLKIVADYDYFIRQQETKVGLENKRKDLEKKLGSLEQRADLVGSFIKTKLELLDSNVSKVFNGIKFQLIKENINGGYDPVCKPYIYDFDAHEASKVSWVSGSKSERVKTGIAISQCIKDALSLPSLPILFDEGGELSSSTIKVLKTDTGSQLICVKVMDGLNEIQAFKL